MTDAELWAAAKGGTLSAFGRLYRREATGLEIDAADRYGRSAPVRQLVVLAFLVVWRTRSSFAVGESVRLAVEDALGDAVGHLAAPLLRPPASRHEIAEDAGCLAEVDPTEAALLYFGAGLPMGVVTDVLAATSVGVITALQRYRDILTGPVLAPTASSSVEPRACR